jgi:hypothetical protein
MRTATAASIGIALGLATAFLAVVGTVIVSAMSNAKAMIPFVFSAEVGTENGLPSVEFAPNMAGLVVWIVVVAVGYTLVLGGVRSQR